MGGNKRSNNQRLLNIHRLSRGERDFGGLWKHKKRLKGTPSHTAPYSAGLLTRLGMARGGETPDVPPTNILMFTPSAKVFHVHSLLSRQLKTFQSESTLLKGITWNFLPQEPRKKTTKKKKKKKKKENASLEELLASFKGKHIHIYLTL